MDVYSLHVCAGNLSSLNYFELILASFGHFRMKLCLKVEIIFHIPAKKSSIFNYWDLCFLAAIEFSICNWGSKLWKLACSHHVQNIVTIVTNAFLSSIIIVVGLEHALVKKTAVDFGEFYFISLSVLWC